MGHERTKKCPLCGEIIHAEAVKCRFCREFLEDDDGLPVSHHAHRPPRRTARERKEHPERAGSAADDDFFIVKPSLWGLLGFFVTSLMFLSIAVFLRTYSLGYILIELGVDTFSEPTYDQIDRYAGLAGLGLGVLTLLNVAVRVARLKSIHYEISTDRIEFARGIFSRKIDNLDMFRVTDLKLHRSLLDCLTGVGTVTLVTKDETDPFFDFEKVAKPKKLYDVIKRASLEADRKQGVVHLD